MSSKRLQVLISAGLDARIQKAAPRSRMSKGEGVRRRLSARLPNNRAPTDPLDRLARARAQLETSRRCWPRSTRAADEGVHRLEHPDARRGHDHPNREPARRFLDRVRTGEFEGCTSTEVLQEILYRYAALGLSTSPGRSRSFVQLCPVVFAVTLADTDRARAMLLRSSPVGVRDAIHAAVMLNNEMTSIGHLIARSIAYRAFRGSRCSQPDAIAQLPGAILHQASAEVFDAHQDGHSTLPRRSSPPKGPLVPAPWSVIFRSSRRRVA